MLEAGRPWVAVRRSPKVNPALFAWIIKERRFGTLKQELLGNENIFILEIRLTSGVQMGALCSLCSPEWIA